MIRAPSLEVTVVAGHSFEVLTPIGPRKQLVDLAVRMAVDDPGEDVSHVGERIDFVQFTGFDE
jgi:hypothetical protein